MVGPELNEGNFASFVGQVRQPTPGVPAGSLVKIEKEGDGWHLFVTIPNLDKKNKKIQWDIWADTWNDVVEWLAEWKVVAS